MKGTIDIQIKRKDGTIENRREHNVVFDIPSLTFKKWSESPLAIITGLPTSSQIVLTGDRFATFALSEDTISTTEPSVVPVALETVTSSPSKWYYGPTTITTTTQSKSISATWTIGEALTLKSIFFYGNSSLSNIFYYDGFILTSKDNIYDADDETKRLRKELMDFSGFQLNGSTSWNGLVSSTISNAYEYVYVDYPLCNPDERFVFSYQNSEGNTVYDASPTVTSTLEIRNKDTNTVIRSFPITQFTGFDVTSSSKMKYRTYVVNTGTKNVFAAATNDGKSLNLWQIPDVATMEPIPISATVLTNYCNYIGTSSNYFKVAGPYIAVQTQSGDYRNVVRINDDFSATTYHGWAGDNNWPGYQYKSGGGNNYPAKYRSGKMFLRVYGGNNATYSPVYPNITASNFSTPIVLAEGDVLTVSYKIEVA